MENEQKKSLLIEFIQGLIGVDCDQEIIESDKREADLIISRITDADIECFWECIGDHSLSDESLNAKKDDFYNDLRDRILGAIKAKERHFSVESYGKPGAFHKVSVKPGFKTICDCLGFTNRGRCKHIEAVERLLECGVVESAKLVYDRGGTELFLTHFDEYVLEQDRE